MLPENVKEEIDNKCHKVDIEAKENKTQEKCLKLLDELEG